MDRCIYEGWNHVQNLFPNQSDQFETEMPVLSHPGGSITQNGKKILNLALYLVMCANSLRNFIS